MMREGIKNMIDRVSGLMVIGETGDGLKLQTSLHQKLSMSKIPWEYSCFRQKNTLSDKNWTLSISGSL